MEEAQRGWLLPAQEEHAGAGTGFKGHSTRGNSPLRAGHCLWLLLSFPPL